MAGKLPEILRVFPNGERSTMYQDSGDGRFMAETMMIKELIPNIDAFLKLTKHLDFIKANLRLQVACGIADPDHLKTVREYHEALTTSGLPQRYLEVEGLGHNQKKMIDGRTATWFDVYVVSLKLNGLPLHFLDP